MAAEPIKFRTTTEIMRLIIGGVLIGHEHVVPRARWGECMLSGGEVGGSNYKGNN